MTKIIILGGAGYTGKSLARHLLEQSKAEIVLAGRRLEKVQAMADKLNADFKGGRVTAVRADAADAASLKAALRGVDLLLDVGDIVMMRKCMLGIKERAEKTPEKG